MQTIEERWGGGQAGAGEEELPAHTMDRTHIEIACRVPSNGLGEMMGLGRSQAPRRMWIAIVLIDQN